MIRTATAIATVFLACLALPGSALAAGGCRNADTVPSAGNLGKVRAAVECMVNRERRAHRLRRLSTSKRLRRAAARHSADMVRRDYFSHATPEGRDPAARLRAVGYLVGARLWAVGENIAQGTGTASTARATVAAWMASPGHRATMLTPQFRHIGVGVRLDGTGATFTAKFGRRR